MGLIFSNPTDRRCACGTEVYDRGRGDRDDRMRKHRRKTGCSGPGSHSTLFSRHCVACGRGV